ncbi:helix-turn-helix domain-containing protein [Streptacidiphilus sp. MAP5-3]|uniref:helix-turn-helix domain-containing protein n=1 Tax=unclassified Streptacidiphilus TaxID=2643834 RepID=UPI003511CB26
MAETFGDLLRRLRVRTGRSQTEQADELCKLMGDPLKSVTRSEVSRYERGKRVPRPRMVRLYAQSYGVPEGELLRAAAIARTARCASTLGEDVPSVDAVPEDPVRRREFMGAAVVGVGLAAEPWSRLSFALGRSGPADSTVSAAMTERTAALFAAEERMPARELYRGLAEHLDQLTVLLGAGGRHRRELLVTAGETAALAGWLAFDMGDLTAAQHYYGAAAQAGHEADHSPLLALVLAYGSYAVDDPVRARDMLRAAQQHVRQPGCATARAWVSAREAEESAAIGDREGALRALERAQAVYDYAHPTVEQPWVRFFSRARLDSMTVAAYARLDHPDLGEVSEAVLQALRPEDAKVRAVILGDVALSYVQRGDLDRGSQIARQAFEVTMRSEATLGKQRLSVVAQQLPDRGSGGRLRDELRALLG